MQATVHGLHLQWQLTEQLNRVGYLELGLLDALPIGPAGGVELALYTDSRALWYLVCNALRHRAPDVNVIPARPELTWVCSVEAAGMHSLHTMQQAGCLSQLRCIACTPTYQVVCPAL